MIFSVFGIVFGFFVGAMTLTDLGGAFPGISMQGPALMSAYMFVNREMVMTLLMVLVVWKRSVHGFLFVYIMRFLTETGDMIAAVASSGGEMRQLLFALSILLFLIPEAFAIRWAWRKLHQ